MTIHIDGLDAVVSDFRFRGDRIRPQSEKVVVEYADKAAQRMRDLVPVDYGTTLESITSDDEATGEGLAVYAEAGPEHFVAIFLEDGTVDTAPQPFVQPALDETAPQFAKAIGDLAR